MKSKSPCKSHTSADTQKQNRTFDFVNLYKSASETSGSFTAQPQTSSVYDTANHKAKSESPKRERSPNKRKKVEKRESIDISHITIDGPGLSSSSAGRGTPTDESKVTSTPLVNRKLQAKSSKVKSIMKNSSVVTDDAMDGSNLDTSTSKPKKRNKSVSFMLGDNEEVVNKKNKSDESTNDSKSDTTIEVKAKRHFKKGKKDRSAEKENKIDVNQQTTENDDSIKEKAQKKSKIKHEKSKTSHAIPNDVAGDSQTSQPGNVNEIKKKHKKAKKVKKSDATTESKETGTENTTSEVPDKTKKPKKKKHQEKPFESQNGEPASKSRKIETKPDVVAELENLSIGDNAHTLTNMLDEMTVVDKAKRKKLKQKFNKNKKAKGVKREDVQDSEKIEDAQEKVKWSRRKWNKDGKSDAKEADLDTTIIVDNLPLSMLFSYKKVLAEHFVKYGLIRGVGIAEVYPTEVSKPVFTTTVSFYSDGAAAQALEDVAVFEGSRVQVRRALAPTETTLVVRSYGPVTAQRISTMFHGAGRVRNIRHSVKGKHSIATFFVELDGPESVERALKLSADAKVAGKKVYVSRFEVRSKKTKPKTNDNEGSDADQSEDSQD